MGKNEIPKAYEAGQYEDAIYAAWEQSGFFNPDTPSPRLRGASNPETFSMVLPPPNVTGTLHMGHAVMLAIEDIMVRFARMRGKKTLWIPGTDHAAIATQAKVEKNLIASGLKDPRRDLGREAFLKHVEEFAAQSHDAIVNQAKKMGASLDWSREAYTLDEKRSLAVRTAFKRMFDDGLIYRGSRVINWCPRCKSTLADDEVNYKEEKSKFYYLKYGPIVIGTARPETKFLDKVIVVHPDDPRYKDIVGKEFDVEWIEGKVQAKVIADKVADMEFGTGAMTITPAHSHEDFAIAKEHGLDVVTIIGEDGDFTEAAGSFVGKNARASRDEIVALLQKKGLVERIDDNYVHNLSVCYRCDTPVEPLPKLQWFVNVNKEFDRNGKSVTLKMLMQNAVRSGAIKIMPERFNATYFNWVDNLRDWNISRQIWFGHRIPVWYCQGGVDGKCLHDCAKPIVSIEPPTRCPACGSDRIEQDPDTFDTWFSAGLWTLSTLGWPDTASPDLRTYHPTTVLETGYDIIFFWVARMILMTTYLVDDVPFKTVYLHGLVRDEQGRKMSKSLDNIINPLDMIAKYGADATRLSLVIGSTPGNDTKLSEEKVAGYRNFTNKLWNVARFVLTTVGEEGLEVRRIGGPEAKTLADRWILSRLDVVVASVTKKLDAYEFSAAGEELRDFTWNDVADWYLEISKIEKNDAVLLHVLEKVLAMWHPFMPFVTEQIWSSWRADASLMLVQAWPEVTGKRDLEAEREFARLQEAVTTIRNIRAMQKIEPVKKVSIAVGDASLLSHAEIIKRLARVEDITVQEKPGIQLMLGSIDLDVERARLQKELDQLRTYLSGLEAKLANKEFVAKAPEKVVNDLKTKQEEAQKKSAAIEQQLQSL